MRTCNLMYVWRMNMKKVSVREEEDQNIEEKPMAHIQMGNADVIPMPYFRKAISRTLVKTKGYTSALRI